MSHSHSDFVYISGRLASPVQMIPTFEMESNVFEYAPIFKLECLFVAEEDPVCSLISFHFWPIKVEPKLEAIVV